jgi:predicted DCC family thiol-disulfide oxidoreductase YuxK
MTDDGFHSTFILYDGDCPFCTNFADYAKLKTQYPDLVLISARDDTLERRAAIAAGYDLDREMLLYHQGQWFAGHKAMAAAAGGGNGPIPMALKLVFDNQLVGPPLYSVLVRLRLFYLRLVGTGRINP